MTWLYGRILFSQKKGRESQPINLGGITLCELSRSQEVLGCVILSHEAWSSHCHRGREQKELAGVEEGKGGVGVLGGHSPAWKMRML